jgi:hypothetical protein
MKASFTAGFAKQKLAEGRAPMVAKFDTGDTIIELETSFPKDRAWKLYRFISGVADQDKNPEDVFKETFGET